MPPAENELAVAVVGGGIAGVAAAYELAKMQREGVRFRFTLFEASDRLGGIVETQRRDGFVFECGPDAWVTEKPWAREVAEELGLGNEIIASNDADRKTWILRDGALHAVPDGMRMMVPTDLDALRASDLFPAEAVEAYAAEPGRAGELKAYAAAHDGEDESVSNFVQRHFGPVVTRAIAAPLLAGVFGGDVERLSAQAVMAPFVAMEKEHGSLILALQAKVKREKHAVFTTLRTGMGSLIDAMRTMLPEGSVRMSTRVERMERVDGLWSIATNAGREIFDAVLMATPVHVAQSLMEGVDRDAAALMEIDASSAVIVAFGFDVEQARSLKIPAGFGLLVPPDAGESELLAATFTDQKFADRVPAGGRSLRLFFGGEAGARLQGESDEALIALGRAEAGKLLGELPAAQIEIVRRWPQSLPQYTVGHGERMQRLQVRVDALRGLRLLGNGYRGVGVPDLIRDARTAARSLIN